jgi:hypothetical protein
VPIFEPLRTTWSEEHLLDAGRSRKAFSEIAKLWATADPDLPERRDALSRLSRSALPASGR